MYPGLYPDYQCRDSFSEDWIRAIQFIRAYSFDYAKLESTSKNISATIVNFTLSLSCTVHSVRRIMMFLNLGNPHLQTKIAVNEK